MTDNYLIPFKTFYVFKTCFATFETIKETYEYILFQVCLKKELKRYLKIKLKVEKLQKEK